MQRFVCTKAYHRPYGMNPCYKKSSKEQDKTRSIFKHFMSDYGGVRFLCLFSCYFCPVSEELHFEFPPLITVSFSHGDAGKGYTL